MPTDDEMISGFCFRFFALASLFEETCALRWKYARKSLFVAILSLKRKFSKQHHTISI